MPRQLALTGAAAAALLQLDGFRDHDWPPLWCAPIASRPDRSVIRTRYWAAPRDVGGVPVAPAALVLRHLARGLEPVGRWAGDHRPLPPRDLVELALEHALRDGLVTLGELHFRGRHDASAATLAAVVARRSALEPPTESYAETRAVQELRRIGYLRLWRQVAIVSGDRQLHRVDFVLPAAGRRARPELVRPEHGLLIEIDSVEHHATPDGFVRDRQRDVHYHSLGYRFVAFTPNQIEHDSSSVRAAIECARAGADPRAQRPSRSRDQRSA